MLTRAAIAYSCW